MGLEQDSHVLDTFKPSGRAEVHDIEPVHPRSYDRDEANLARVGKKQVLQRNFGLASMTGFSCTLMGTWEGTLILFVLGFQNGGPAGLIYGILVAWIGTTSVFITLGELSSMAPTAGGQYHWVSMLAPTYSKKFLSYITGWLTVVGWVCASAAAMYLSSGLLQALITQNNPSFSPTGWQGTMIYWAVLLLCLLINTVLSKALPVIEVLFLVLHILGFFAILIPLVWLAPRPTSSHIFTDFINNGGWSTQALSVFVGLNGNAAAFVGTDGAIHMSEEIKDSSRNTPRSMILSITINGCLAFGMMIALLFCIDLSAAAASTASFPFVPILAESLGSNAACTILVSAVFILSIGGAVGSVAAASRMMWSFSRDHGLPGWRLLSQINSRTTIPLWSIAAVSVIVALLGLINIGSAIAFSDTISLILQCLFTSYFIACSLLLYRRIRGEIGAPLSATNTTAGATIALYNWGTWRVNGILGILNNIVACLYLVIIGFFSFWPAKREVTLEDMNYSSLVMGVVAIFCMVYYFLSARRSYHGPIIETTVSSAVSAVSDLK